MDDQAMMHNQSPAEQWQRLRAIMHRLRAPGGCPWDAEQTHQSLVANLIEESFECVDAIQRDDMSHLREELGDLLLQVIFHSEIAAERGDFTVDDVAQGICDKLVRRHPHVFGHAAEMNSDAVLRQWDDIKRAERGDQHEPYLKGVGKGLPGMLRALKLQKKVAKVGFDWPDLKGVLAKAEEEWHEWQHELHSGDTARATAELGDVLFSLVNVMRCQGLDPEAVMAQANNKFEQRFHAMEQRLREENLSLDAADLARMEATWQAVK